MNCRYGWVMPVITALILFGFGYGHCRAETRTVLTLQESIDAALQQSVMIHAAREGAKGADAQRMEALKGFLPKFSTSYNYTRLNAPPVSKATRPGTVFPVTALQVGTQDNYTWALEVKQPLFAGGGLLANYRINKLGVDIARWDEVASIRDIILEVKISYFDILKALRILDVANQSVAQLKAHRDTAQSFYEVGIIPKNDLLYAEVQLANGYQFLVRAVNGVELAKSKFNTLLRRDINTPVEVEDIMDYKPFEKNLNDCLSEAMENRPEIKSFNLKVEQAKGAVNLARSGYLPVVSAVGNYSRFGDGPDVSGSLYNKQESWYLMAVASWDFWEWGKTKDIVDYSQTRVNQSMDVLANLRDQITLEVKSAYVLLHESEEQILVTRKAIEQAEENFRINEERYREQVATSIDVLDGQTLLTKTKSDYQNSLGDYNINCARLERAMGIR